MNPALSHDAALIEAIRKFVETAQNNDYPTSRELAKALGWSRKKVLEVIVEMEERGMVAPVPVRRRSADGRFRPSTGYMLITNPLAPDPK